MNFREYKEDILTSDTDLKAEYDALETQYELISAVIAARLEQNISQETLAKRIGTKQSNISRFESGNYNPSLGFINKIANALGRRISIKLNG
ncbi:MAG: hypothetical protein PWP10_4114 [Clostridiales bacterium]|jgi:ribosome-binding protein aMBF1 (putative translation factor)|nr:helix-turn-helix transcriptional regulator [Eubacteriales bacterium]MDD3198540.1 helix-turn-helix transcriptional regulator [Eubacteriales bacterium]MDD3503995.1 helix-turn-helix transcriptional regulator [Eubacteriales bacterium]MDD4682049.1 helix-turn-helix transcriptional regulator [Eubacteriales bacterium]MDN5315364.1 hypothetical protein [Clostridiales bacterium]